MNDTFYAADVTARGLCDWLGCEAFSPSAATIKVRSDERVGIGIAHPDAHFP